MDKNIIYNADCLDEVEGVARLPDNSVDMILTDIPYNEVNRVCGFKGRSMDKGVADSAIFDIKILLSETVRLCNGSIYIFCGTEQVSQIRSFFVSSGLTTRVVVWEKTNPAPFNGDRLWLSSIELCVFARKPKATFNGYCKSTVLRYPISRESKHPTTKPSKLFEEIIKTSSNEGDTVLDCFMGPGTTAIACMRTGRDYIGWEKEKDYYDICMNRIEEEQKKLDVRWF